MLRTTPRLALLTLCLVAHAGLAGAQTTAQTQQTAPRPAAQQPAQTPAQQAQQQRQLQQPPQLERIEPGSDVPATTIEPRPRTRITEHRSNDGRVTEVEVESSGSHYSLKPNTPAGNAQPGDAQSTAGRAPQWKVVEFDFGNPKKQDTTAEPVTPAQPRTGLPTRADAPPPPALEPTTKQ